ncbi:MAG: hypothetical protein GF397_04155 [Elusimicrobia bacterium]|nr:hypothetical protein [Elusimicrobiota bacterium]
MQKLHVFIAMVLLIVNVLVPVYPLAPPGFNETASAEQSSAEQWVMNWNLRIYHDQQEVASWRAMRDQIKAITKSPLRVYYPFMGPGGGYTMDIISPLLSTDFDELTGVEIDDVTFGQFKFSVTYQLGRLGVPAKNIICEEKQSGKKYRAEFLFQGRKRSLIVRCGYDAYADFQMPENGYDVVYLRNVPVDFYDQMPFEMFTHWLVSLDRGHTGFLVLDHYRFLRASKKAREHFHQMLYGFRHLPLDPEYSQRLFVNQHPAVPVSVDVGDIRTEKSL